MNRQKFAQNLPRFVCGTCNAPLWKVFGFWISSNNKKICRKCREKEEAEYKSIEQFSVWRKKSSASSIFPEFLFFDGNTVLDLDSKEYVHMKPADILIYYFRVREEKDYEVYAPEIDEED